jgi:hypothetical protein
LASTASIPFLDRLPQDGVAIEAAPVVADFDVDAAGFVIGVQFDRAARRLAAREARRGRLDAVIDRVAHEVHQRVADPVDHRLVEFGIGAQDAQLDLLAKLPGKVANDARKAREDLADGHHAQAQRHVADVFDQREQQFGRFLKVGPLEATDLQVGSDAGDDQFADPIDQGVKPVGRDLDEARFAAALFFDPLLLVRRGLDDHRRHGSLFDEDFAQASAGPVDSVRRAPPSVRWRSPSRRRRAFRQSVRRLRGATR